MKRLIICLTNDILYDRRMRRTIEVLSAKYTIEVICRKLHDEGVDIQNVSIHRLQCQFNRGFLFYLEFNLRLLVKLLFRKYDIVLAVDYDTIIAAALSRSLKGKTLVFDAHEYFDESVEIVDRKRIQRFWKWVGKTFVPVADKAYTVSQTIASEYSRLYKVDFEVIRNVPELKQFQVPHNGTKQIILYQGVLNQGRELEMLLEASKHMQGPYEFWIVGEGDLSSELKKNAGKNVIFHSWVHPDQLAILTRQASIGYNLLDTKSKSYYFSLANKFFDYLHAGVPSINNNYPEYVRINERYNCCFTIDIQEPAALASFIKDKLEAKEEMKEMTKNGKLASRDLCWERESERLLEIYKNL